MKMAWHDLFIYSFKTPAPSSFCPCHKGCVCVSVEVVGVGGGAVSNTHRKHFFLININDSFLYSLFSIDHLALSSINLQNALFKLLINTLIDLQKCHHSEARAADGSEPTVVQFPTVREWWMLEWMCTLQSARQGWWILGRGVRLK